MTAQHTKIHYSFIKLASLFFVVGIAFIFSASQAHAAIGYRYQYYTCQTLNGCPPPQGYQIEGPYQVGHQNPEVRRGCADIGYPTRSADNFDPPDPDMKSMYACYEYYNAVDTIYTFDGAGQEMTFYYGDVTPLPDLVGGTITPTTATAGSATTLNSIISNIGAAASGSFPVLYQVQETGALVSGAYVASIPAGSTGASSASYTFPSSGTYNVRACANNNPSWTNIVTESNYTNNCGPWTVVTVSSALAASCSASPSTVALGGSTTWTAAASGGVAPYTYSWSATGGSPASGSGSSLTSSYASVGSYSASVTVNDSAGHSTGSISCSNSLSVTAGPTMEKY